MEVKMLKNYLNISFKFIRLTGLIGLWLSLSFGTRAQGPSPAYYYNPAAEIPWARCSVYQEGGSRLKIPFLPVVSVNYRRAPLGINNYSKDVCVEGPVVFIGNGIFKEKVWNSYRGKRRNYTTGDIDAAGKAVVFCYDFPDKIAEQLKKEIPLTERISEAASRNAAAVLIFSHRDQSPFLTASYTKESEIPDIPVISITRKSFHDIFLSDFDVDAESILKKWEETGQPPEAVELSAKLHLEIEGAFEKAETDNFLIRFRSGVFSKEEMEKTVDINEKSLRFLFECFAEDKELAWNRLLTVYFRGFDSKVFYTHHMGWGLASEEGTFVIFKGGVPDFGLAVHENTHILTRLNWGDSSSFVNEGLGKYTEALATDKDKNHRSVINFLKDSQLFPLKEMIDFSIGSSGLKTLVGYPASGSFFGFLIETYGLKPVKDVTRLEGRPSPERERTDSWQKAFGKSISELEKEWLYWLMKNYKIEEDSILKHLEKASKERKIIELDPRILDAYVGQYRFSTGFIFTITKEEGRLYLEGSGMGKSKLVPESDTQFTVKSFDAGISFQKNEKGEVSHFVVHTGGGEMRAEKIK